MINQIDIQESTGEELAELLLTEFTTLSRVQNNIQIIQKELERRKSEKDKPVPEDVK